MLKQRLRNLCNLLLFARKKGHILPTDITISSTAAATTGSKKAVELLYHHGLKNNAHGTFTDKNANGHEWIIN